MSPTLDLHCTTVDKQFDSNDEARIVGRETDGCFCNLFRLPHSAERDGRDREQIGLLDAMSEQVSPGK
jgi:hypothetical protein